MPERHGCRRKCSNIALQAFFSQFCKFLHYQYVDENIIIFYSCQCVDEWLRVNATCPTCRESILASHDEESGGSPVSTSMERDTSSREEEEKRNEDNFNNADDVESIPLVS